MALTDKDIVITPNKGASAATPSTINFVGADASNSASITLQVFNNSTTGILGFLGNTTGVPALAITDTATQKVAIGSTATNGAYTLTVTGNIGATTGVTSNVYYDSASASYYLQPSGTSRVQAISALGSEASSHDPYGLIGVTRGTASNYSYYGLTRQSNIGMGIGIDTSNNLWFGGTSGGINATRSSIYFYTDTSGNVIANTSLRAPTFYYSANTAYYLSLSAATGTILSSAASTDTLGYNSSYGVYIGGTPSGVYLYNGGTSGYPNSPVWVKSGTAYAVLTSGNIGSYAIGTAGGTITGQLGISFNNSTVINSYANVGLAQLRLDNPTGSQSHIVWTFNGSLLGSQRVDSSGNMILNANSSNFYYNYDLGASSGITFRLNSSATIFQQVNTSGNVTFPQNFYGPRFVDSDNNSYYVDPGSTSNIYGLTTSGPSQFGPTAYGGNYNENMRLVRNSSNQYVCLAMAADTSGAGSISGQFNQIVYPSGTNGGAFAIRSNSTDALQISTTPNVIVPTGSFYVNTGNSYVYGTMYDYQNGSYYVKPSGTSNLYSGYFASYLQASDKLQVNGGGFAVPTSYKNVPGITPGTSGSWLRGSSTIIQAGASGTDGSGWSYGSRFSSVDYGDGLATSVDVLYAAGWTNDVMTWSGRSGRIGSVGINQTAPSHKLDIYTGNTEDGIIIDAISYPEILFKTQGTNRGYLAWSNSGGGFGASNVGMVLRSEGNYLTFLTGAGSYQPLILSTTNAYLTGTLYDNQNSAYYLKPSGTSNLNQLYTYEFLKRHNRYNTGEAYPVSYHSDGDLVWSLDPTWDNTELQTYFGNSNVSWVADSTAPGGYAISIVGGVNVGSNTYGSGFPMIPIDSVDDIFYMEVWIKNVSGSNGHYMGSIDYNESFGNLGGNPGSYGYWVMVGNNPGTSWSKWYGYITGFSGSTYGTFRTGAKYWTPQALFNYTGGGTTYISGWKVLRVNRQTSMVINTPNGSSSTGSSNSQGQTLTIKRSGTSQLNLGSYPGAWTSALQIQDNNASNWIWMSPLTANTPTVATNYGQMFFYMAGQNTGFAGGMYNGSFRSPIFYDYDNTGYYIDGNNTSNLNALTINSGSVNSNGRWQFGPNSSWGQYLLIGGNGIDGSYAQIAATNGNLHLESLSSSYGTYINWYRGGPIYLNGTTYVTGTLYDNNNTGYYVVPRGTSNLNVLYTQVHYNYYGIVTNPQGNNSDSYGQAISFWTSPTGTTSLINFKYGPSNFGTYGYQTDGYGTYFTMDTPGRAWVFRSPEQGNKASITNTGEAYFAGRLYAGTQVQSPIFYDANDSAYFTDPNGRSRMSSIDYGNSGYYFGGGDWGWRNNTPYGWIQFGPANSGYAHIYSSGLPFYFNSNVFHGVFYDYDNSGYYCKPAGTSNFNTLYMQGNFIPASSNGGGGNFYFGNQWGGGVGGQNSTVGITYSGGSGHQLFTFSSGPGQMSVQVDGSLFAGDSATGWNPLGLNSSSNGYLSIANSMQNGGSSYTNGSHYVSGYYYDYANTGYYLKASGQSVLSYLTTRSGAMGIYLGYSDVGSISTYNLVGLGYNGNDTNYAIYKPTGGWTQPLYIQFYTGIRHYSHHAYDYGTSFWNIATGTRMMWIGGGDDNVRIQSSLFMYGAHYDYNNTAYYIQPYNDSRMYSLYCDIGVRFISSQADRVNGAPWYGIGASNQGGWAGPGMVQVASYYGLRLRGQSTVLDLDGPNYGNGWSYFSGTNIANNGQTRSDIYYDINNTGYYMRPRDTSVFYYIQANNYIYSSNSVYGTIFYDSNNSGYYCDPNGTSRLNYVNADSHAGPGTSGCQLVGYYGGSGNYYSDFYNTAAERYSYVGDIPGGTANPGNTWWFNTNYRHNNGGGYWGTQVAWGWEDNGNRLAQRNVSNGNWSGWVYYLNSGNYTGYNSYGSIYFTIGYDNNNSGYYIDPNSTSQLSYVLADNWFRPQGTGLYFQNYGYGLIQVHGYGSYGNVSTYGTGLNGWSGYNISPGNMTFMCEGGTWGIYSPAGGWKIYGQPGNGTVGVNGGNNSSYALFVNGTIYATSNVYAYSDARSKENIITIDNALGKVTQLRGVYYNRTDRPEGEESGYTSTLNSRELGVIAQEIMSIVPEAVSYSENTDRYGVNYGNLAGLFIEAIKDLKKEIEDLRSELNMLKGN